MKWHSKGHLVSWWQSWNLVFLIVFHLLGVISSMARDSISNIKNIPWNKYSLKWTANPFTSWCNDLLIPSHAIYFQFTKRIPVQRLVIWKMRNIFSQDSAMRGGYGLRLTPGNLPNSQHDSERILRDNTLQWYQKLNCQEVAGWSLTSYIIWAQFLKAPKKHGNYFDS